MADRNEPSREPCYVISVAAKLVNMHPQTLRYYERLGLVQPSRSSGRIRLYSDEDVQRLQQIQRLTNDLGVNLAGVQVILQLMEKIREMEREAEATYRQLSAEVDRLRQRLSEARAVEDEPSGQRTEAMGLSDARSGGELK